jgi:tripeptide aminopeptidase
MDKLLAEFLELTAFSVPSKQEAEIRKSLKQKLLDLGFTVWEDQAFPETGSGSLYGRLDGTGNPILLTAHMDTVTPCEHKKITVEPDGTIHTDGTTILGGDDVTGIVELLAALWRIKQENIPHRTIEVVFTACEEYFVEGAKRLRYDTLTAKEAYILDTDGPIGRAVLAAPTGVRILANITGKAAHAALAPEDGVNAIAIASAAISRMRLGRIDPETTANIGIIRGGDSGNIVPGTCFVEGETRSLNHEAALRQKDHMEDCFRQAAANLGGSCDLTSTVVYNAWSVDETEPLCRNFAAACQKTGLTAKFERACGGSDASFLAEHGIRCLILATGMHEIHSVREYTTLAEMTAMADTVYHLLTNG